MKIHKFALYAIVVLFVFGFGHCPGQTKSDHETSNTSNVYVYDTPQKVEEYHKKVKETLLSGGLSANSPEVKDMINILRKKPPLAVVGSVAVFFNNKSQDYMVCDKNIDKPLVEWETDGKRLDHLYLYSKVEKDWRYPRFESAYSYSRDGAYHNGGLFVFDQHGSLSRAYYDTQGKGVLDKMDVFDNGIQITYHMKGLSWEKTSEKKYGERLSNYEKLLQRVKTTSKEPADSPAQVTVPVQRLSDESKTEDETPKPEEK